MNKQIRLFLVLICLPLMIAATDKINFAVSGVKGKMLANIKARLIELSQIKPLSRETDEILRLQVTQAMEPYGYFKPEISLSRQPLRFNINPGPQMLISHVQIELIGEGAENSEIRKALSDLKIQSGKVFNSANYEETKQNLLTAAENQGYLHGSFQKAEVVIDLNSNSAAILLIFNTGPQYFFGQVTFSPSYVSPELLYRYVPFKYGQPYSTEQILAFNSQLSSSGYFKSVIVKPQIGDARFIPIDVSTQRASRINYSLGLGYGTDTGPRGRAGLHIAPVNRAGHKFNAALLGSFYQNFLQTQYIIPGKNPVTDQYHINGVLSDLNYNSGYSNSALVSLVQQHRLPSFQRNLSLNALYERYHYTLKPKEEKLTFFPKASYTWIRASDKLFSPSGYNITLTGLGASKALLSQENFIQGAINAKAAFTIPAIRTRFYLHAIQGITLINDVNQLPLSLALLLGGADNLKAYSFNAIGPGRILSYGGIEIQKETFEHWYFVGFFDSGDVYNPRARNLQNDVGIGLMWVSPVGPIKIGVAQAVNSHFDRMKRNPKLVINMGPDL